MQLDEWTFAQTGSLKAIVSYTLTGKCLRHCIAKGSGAFACIRDPLFNATDNPCGKPNLMSNVFVTERSRPVYKWDGKLILVR